MQIIALPQALLQWTEPYLHMLYFSLFQFDCLNTLNDQLLENVHVQVEPPDGYQLVHEIPCPRLPYSEGGTTYVVLQFPEELGATVGELHFQISVDCSQFKMVHINGTDCKIIMWSLVMWFAFSPFLNITYFLWQ